MGVQKCWRCNGDGWILNPSTGRQDCPFKNSDYFGHEPQYSIKKREEEINDARNQSNGNSLNNDVNPGNGCLLIFIFFISFFTIYISSL